MSPPSFCSAGRPVGRLQSRHPHRLWSVVLPVALASAAASAGEFTSFEFPADPGVAAWYSRYTESFFTNRIDIGQAIFPAEYLAIADAWLNDAAWKGLSVNPLTREKLLAKQIDVEGYVSSHQHPSSSLDTGWPFPVWPQVPGSEGWVGVTAGWHFYEEPRGWEIVVRHVRAERDRSFPESTGLPATAAWGLADLEDQGLVVTNQSWQLKATGSFPTLTSPEGVVLDAFNCPYVQIRWRSSGAFSGEHTPYLEWLGAADREWSESRRMYFYPDGSGEMSGETGMYHSMLPVYRHPAWTGAIQRIRFCLSPGRAGETFQVRSIFSHWDTRHLVNNAIYIKASGELFRWTGDLDLLRRLLPRLRRALRYLMEEGHGLELNHIRCSWPGHDGRPGYTVHPDGSKTWHVGHGKGGNYWDLLPLGWDDMYTTTHYYAALVAMAEIEERVAEHPGWAMPRTLDQFDPAFLRAHAEQVKETANTKFWNEAAGRFVGCIDADGIPHDYGFTFVNLEAVHYGIADPGHAQAIMTWIDGARMVAGDTSTGADIYIHRLAPRATTRRNLEWYGFFWTNPERLPFGGQVQDGGAVLGFSFYDIMSRIRVLGPDNAWQRLMAIRAWDEEVTAYGGYRKYYGDGKGTTTLQGGGTAGGIGIDWEFTESSLLSAVVPLGFMGLQPDGAVLYIAPRLPAACPEMTVRNLKYQGARMDITVSADQAMVVLNDPPPADIQVRFLDITRVLDRPGTYEFSRLSP